MVLAIRECKKIYNVWYGFLLFGIKRVVIFYVQVLVSVYDSRIMVGGWLTHTQLGGWKLVAWLMFILMCATKNFHFAFLPHKTSSLP